MLPDRVNEDPRAAFVSCSTGDPGAVGAVPRLVCRGAWWDFLDNNADDDDKEDVTGSLGVSGCDTDFFFTPPWCDGRFFSFLVMDVLLCTSDVPSLPCRTNNFSCFFFFFWVCETRVDGSCLSVGWRSTTVLFTSLSKEETRMEDGVEHRAFSFLEGFACGTKDDFEAESTEVVEVENVPFMGGEGVEEVFAASLDVDSDDAEARPSRLRRRRGGEVRGGRGGGEGT